MVWFEKYFMLNLLKHMERWNDVPFTNAIFTYILICKYNRLIGLVGRVFASDRGDRSSIPGRVIPKI